MANSTLPVCQYLSLSVLTVALSIILPAVLVSQLFRDEMEFIKKHCLESMRINDYCPVTEYLGTGTLRLDQDSRGVTRLTATLRPKSPNLTLTLRNHNNNIDTKLKS